MKLRNKKTGEILGSLGSFIIQNPNGINCETITKYDSLAELNEEWEDYKEPKDTNYWYIDSLGKIEFHSTILDEIAGTPNNAMIRKIIGNYFASREEAEKAVEKLKAWKRLKDKGFRFNGYSRYDWNGNKSPAIAFEYSDFNKLFDDGQVVADLDLLFGGEE